MTTLLDRRPATLVVSLLAALTTWVTLLAWAPFAQEPAGFLRPIAFAALLVAVSGMLLRSVRVPAGLVVVAQLVLLWLWFQQAYAPGTALGGLVPTGETVSTFADVLYDAGVASQEYAAPVPASAPELYPMLVVAGSLIAVVVDLLAVGLRRAPLAGLPLLAAYTAPVSIVAGGVSWLTFAAAAVCFVLLVAADQERRLLHWGQHLTPGGGAFESRAGMAGTGAVWASARTIGFTATALAVVAPLLVPTFSATFFDGEGGAGGGDGDEVQISNPMVDLKRDLVRGEDLDLVRLRTNDPDPAYLRLTVLNTFDGNAWRPTGRDIPREQNTDGPIGAAPGLDADVRTEPVRAEVDVADYFTTRWLPTPYPVTSITARGSWRWDRTTLDFVSADEDETAADLSYTLRALRVQPTAEQLATAGVAPLDVLTPNVDLPDDFPQEVEDLTDSVVDPDASRFEQAVQLQQWFREDGGFEYSLDQSSGNGTDELLAFLRPGDGGRVGYCEQFAAAMAVMGRTLGIPSRVAVGFLRPERTGPDSYVYSAHDLHAWPEMYFAGTGWVRFEPTPQGRAAGVPAYTTQDVAPTEAPSSGAATPTAPLNQGDRVPDAASGADGGDGSSSGPTLVTVGAATIALLLVLAVLPRTVRSVVRRRRWSAAAGSAEPAAWVEAAWAEVRDTAVDLRLPWDDRVTLRGTAARLAQSFADPGSPEEAGRAGERGPAAAADAQVALHRLVRLLERARYARALPPDAVTREQVRADLDAVLAALAAGAGRERRRKARWWPVSLRSAGRQSRGVRVARLAPSGEAGVDRAV